MACGPQDGNVVFKVRRWRLDGCLVSWALTWLEPKTISHGATVLICFDWLLSFPSWGDVEGLLYHLHGPANYSWQARVQSILTGAITSCHDLCLPFRGGAKPLRQTIYHGVDRPGPWWTESSLENSAYLGVSLCDVRVTIAIMCVLVEELPCQALMGQNLVLECLLSGMRGWWRLRLVSPGIKWHRYSRTPVF
jgi:hypothetical protein